MTINHFEQPFGRIPIGITKDCLFIINTLRYGHKLWKLEADTIDYLNIAQNGLQSLPNLPGKNEFDLSLSIRNHKDFKNYHEWRMSLDDESLKFQVVSWSPAGPTGFHGNVTSEIKFGSNVAGYSEEDFKKFREWLGSVHYCIEGDEETRELTWISIRK